MLGLCDCDRASTAKDIHGEEISPLGSDGWAWSRLSGIFTTYMVNASWALAMSWTERSSLEMKELEATADLLLGHVWEVSQRVHGQVMFYRNLELAGAPSRTILNQYYTLTFRSLSSGCWSLALSSAVRRHLGRYWY